MARLLIASEEAWYDEWSVVSSYYESEYEDVIISNVRDIFPNYTVVKFKKEITSPITNNTRKPDLALIHNEYKDWWIVEIELSGHDFHHIESQIEAFANGNYNKFSVAKYISDKDYSKKLKTNKLESMVEFNPPKVLVIVDEYNPAWEEDLLKYDAKLCVLQVYKNKNGYHAYRLDGKYPLIIENSSHCRFHPSVANLLEIFNPEWFVEKYSRIKKDKMSLKPTLRAKILDMILTRILKRKKILEEPKVENEIEIEYNGKISRCKIIFDDKKVYLKPLGMNKFPVIYDYVLESDSTHRFYLKLN